MKRTIVVPGLTGVWGILLCFLIACEPVEKVNLDSEVLLASVGRSAPPSVEAGILSCANPTTQMMTTCQEEAERILASTVRLEFDGLDEIGHATVIGGRYLITHNHYSVSAEALSRGGDGLVTAVSIRRVNGDVVLLKVPLSYFSVAMIAPEVMLLDFREYNGVGFFDSLGIPSAEIASVTDLTLQPGSVVAQIDWDMTTSHVSWARVTAVHAEGNAPYVVLDSFVEQGASGGGVFHNGIHVGNNWSRNTDRQAETGEVLRRYSLAALNIVPVAANTVEIASAGN